jgi:DnaJ-class molecular chaperone
VTTRPQLALVDTTTGELVPCPRCHGDGDIMVNTSRIRDPQEDRLERCPDCHGEGVQ